jgi:hypothetical protein
VTKNLKGIFCAGCNEIPDHLDQQCIKLIKKPLSHIYDASFESGILPCRLKMAKVKPL